MSLSVHKISLLIYAPPVYGLCRYKYKYLNHFNSKLFSSYSRMRVAAVSVYQKCIIMCECDQMSSMSWLLVTSSLLSVSSQLLSSKPLIGQCYHNCCHPSLLLVSQPHLWLALTALWCQRLILSGHSPINILIIKNWASIWSLSLQIWDAR